MRVSIKVVKGRITEYLNSPIHCDTFLQGGHILLKSQEARVETLLLVCGLTSS